ncbi:hypothetical protein BRC83_01190 [Halobacteriales archaeon QS_1_68_17]|nr:MAG: hypothetical protein BRC83_01190 [Halobacteriales archaeon QS_1_68_17]
MSGDEAADATDELARLRATSDWLERALAASDTYAWNWDLETDTVERHPSFEELFGLDAEELEPLFENFFDRVRPEDREAVEAAFEAAAEEGSTYEVQYAIRTGDGSWGWLDGRGEVVTDEDGEPTRVLGTTRRIPGPENA